MLSSCPSPCLQLVERHRHAALLEIHLLRRAEPQHVLSPLGNGLDVQQVLHADVLGDGVAAPRSRSPASATAAILKLYRSPMPPKLLGVLMTMRQASMRCGVLHAIFSFCAGWMYRDAVWPWPPSADEPFGLCRAPRQSPSRGTSPAPGRASHARTPRKARQLSTSPMRIFVSSGTSTPASAAMVCALWPTIFAFSAPLIKIVWRT